MKLTDIKKKLTYLAFGAVMLAPALSSCELEVEPVPAEELYLRAFIKKYGLIDPSQDWNQAMKANVSVRVPDDGADEVNVFIRCGDRFYRVAFYASVTGSVTIPFDIPEGTETIYVQVDSRIFTTTPGGSVDASGRKKAPSRADYSSQLRRQVWGSRADGITRGSIELPDNINAAIDVTQRFFSENLYTGDQITTPGSAMTAVGDNYHFAMAQGDKAFTQIHSNRDKVASYLLSFDTNASAGTTLFIRMDNGAFAETLSLSGSEHHELMISNVPTGDQYPQIGIYLVEGSVSSIGNFVISEFNPGDMAWLLVAEDLGATDDFDFNDIIIRIESTTANEAALVLQNEWWQVIRDDNSHMVLGAPSRPGTQSRAKNYTVLRVRSLSAGGILDSYLHFRNGDKDFILGPGVEIDAANGNPASYEVKEWHQWFDEGGRESQIKDLRNMLNTGLNTASTKTATIIVPDGFSMTQYSVDFRNYTGNKTPGQSADDWTGSVYDEWDPTASHEYNIQGFYMTTHDPDPSAAGANVITAPKPGAAPHMFLIPDAGWGGYWHWPLERVSITDVYPRFKEWIVSSGFSATWYLDEPKHSARTKEDENKTDPYISIDR